MKNKTYKRFYEINGDYPPVWDRGFQTGYFMAKSMDTKITVPMRVEWDGDVYWATFRNRRDYESLCTHFIGGEV